jgi:hypothetical protein
MSAALYIILERTIPGADTYVNGKSLAKNIDELGRMAKRLGVTPLMDFFSCSSEELSALAEEHSANLDKIKATHEEKWFAAEEGLRTVNALLGSLVKSKLAQVERIEADLQEFVRVLELAKSKGIKWHLSVDY